MTDVAVATTAFLDMTFVGLTEVPEPGQERFAVDLLRSPGGGAITAIGCARLGLDAALASPLGSDTAADFIAEELRREGVRMVEPHPGSTATTVILPVAGDRAMITHDPGVRPRTADIAALGPRAAVTDLAQLAVMPQGPWLYATCGDDGAQLFSGSLPGSVSGARALLVNDAEAELLTGEADPAAAAALLAEQVETVIVTRGAEGAYALVEGRAIDTPGVDAGPAVDTTGAGDLFAAAYIWGDLQGADPDARVAWATLYAALSVVTATGSGGAVTESRLIEEGTRRGLARHAVPAGRDSFALPQKERYT